MRWTTLGLAPAWIANDAVFQTTLTAMMEGLPVAVPAWLLPPWVRPKLPAGHPTPVAQLTVDDRVVLRTETPAEILAWLGLD